jgi:glycosyltransferase involved in cell wall biosynthesis
MRRTPTIISIDCTQTLASLESPSPFARQTYRPNVAHDGRVFRAAAAIISISQWAAADLARVYPDCAEKVRVMPYPVRLDCFPDTLTEERHARRVADPGAPVRLLFIGGDFPRKGGFDLLEAWRAGSFGEFARLDLVTDWPLDESELPTGVRLVRGVAPFTPEWSQLWRDAEVFVMPTCSEAFGMVYQEAAAAGLPAIGTAINAVPEIIDEDSSGLLVPPRDVPALVRAMTALARSSEQRRQMGEMARHRAEAMYSPSQYAAKLTALLKQLILDAVAERAA